MRSPARPLAAAALAVALAGCATARPAAAPSCEAVFDHVDGLLRAGLASYVAQMGRYAAARDPGATTAPAAERARRRADAWAAERRPAFVGACRAWPEERVRCAMLADVPRVLPACGLEELVASFTDDVVAGFAARPIEPAAARAR